MPRFTRVLIVTGGLIGAGIAFGAVASAAAFAIAVALTDGLSAAADRELLGFAAYFGAVIGAVVAPAAGWGLLRRVPLGRAVAWTTFAAVIGGAAGWVVGTAIRSRLGGPLPIIGDEVSAAVLGAVVGFAVMAFRLRRRASVPPAVPGDSPTAAV
jgi:hypothetical protein